jgi:hypothetical protein
MQRKGMERMLAMEQEDDSIVLLLPNHVGPVAFISEHGALDPLRADGVDKSILAQFAPSSKKAYDRYKAQYLETKPETHSEESVLAYLLKCKDERNYKPTTLWSVRSLILCFLRHELKIEVTDFRTSKLLKKLGGIFIDIASYSFFCSLFCIFFDFYYKNI